MRTPRTFVSWCIEKQIAMDQLALKKIEEHQRSSGKRMKEERKLMDDSMHTPESEKRPSLSFLF